MTHAEISAPREVFGKPVTFWWATFQNVVAYFGVTFLALWIGPAVAGAIDSGSIDTQAVRLLLDVSVIGKCAAAAVVATFGFIKSLAGGAIGNPASPSWLPASVDPPAIILPPQNDGVISDPGVVTLGAVLVVLGIGVAIAIVLALLL